jgi:Fanconi anemia group M protein
MTSSNTIYVDSREKRSAISVRLSRLGFSVRSKKLPVGDYWLPGKFVIERKEANDFITSIMNGHLFKQAELLASHDDRPFIILEGNLDEIYSSIDPESVAGAISALLIFYEIAVAPTPNADASTRLIGRMITHSTHGLGYEIPLRRNKPKFDGGAALFLVEGLPGVGPEMARKLISHFDTPAKVFAATKHELGEVKGVGPKTVDSIHGALNFAPTSFRTTKTAP